MTHSGKDAKRSEEPLDPKAEDEERLARLIRESQAIAKVGGWEYDLASATLFWTDEVYRIHETSREEYHPTVESALAFYTPESAPVIGAAVRRAIAQGCGYELDLEALTARGRRIWVHTIGRPRLLAGRMVALQGFVQDISERKRTEEALRVSEEKFTKLFRMSPVAIDLVDTSDRVCLDFNQAFGDLFGYAREEFIGRTLLPADQDLWVNLEDRTRLMARLKEQGMVNGFETPHRRKDGTVFQAEISVSSLEIGGRPCHLSFTRDVTERKRAEEDRLRVREQFHQAQKLEALASLTGGVAHTVNNVLTIILGTASMHEELTTEPADREAYQVIGQACLRGREVVKALTNFARRELPDQAPLDLQDLLRGMLDLLERLGRERVAITATFADGPLWIRGDAGALKLALLCLCLNAMEAMPGGGQLALRTTGLGRDLVEVAIEDDGLGMSSEVLGQAMNPFFTTKEVGKGLGLGLSMAYGVVKAHGGTLDITSRPDRGTLVKLLLPRIAGQDAEGGGAS
jgi:PAS domain S-box-containing protein